MTSETFRAIAITERGKDRPLVPESEIRLTFSGDTITANAGCNEITGRASRDGDQRLLVTDLVTTDMACGADLGGQESWLVAFLKDRPTWQRAGTELVLRTATAELRLTT